MEMAPGSEVSLFYLKIFRYLSCDDIWEAEPLSQLASDGQLRAYQHKGFWQPMDALHDKIYLEKLWSWKSLANLVK